MAEPRLQVQDSHGGRRLVVLDRPLMTIGRSADCAVRLTDAEVSRDHAEIEQVHGRFVVRDRGSKFGTFVNSEPVTAERALAHGDVIRLGRLGRVELRFLINDEPLSSSVLDSSIVGGFQQLKKLIEGLRSGRALVLDDVLALVLDAAIEVTGAERGFIMLADPAGMLEFKLARGEGKVTLSGDRFDMSRKIPEEVFATGRDAAIDLLEVPDDHEGTIVHGIRYVRCVPLRVVRIVERADVSIDSRPIGVLYLDGRQKATLMSRAAAASLTALANEAADAIESARLWREARDNARIVEELRVAFQIQQALLPRPARSASFFDAVAASVPCSEIGGDFFDYMDLAGNRFGFALGDVAGKGTPAALLAAVIQGIFVGHVQTSYDPGVMMAAVNRSLVTRAVEARFATVFLGVLEPGGMLTYCNAGHSLPFLFSSTGVQRLAGGGTVLGMFAGARYESVAVQLQPGDTVIVFSDGVSEARNPLAEEFGDDRISSTLAPIAGQPVQAVLDALLRAVREFAATVPQHDDITALVVRYLA
jgi:serine phosphatase RsbU (regulator of sigma subunit)/pSer/pThr/pTyr-binding forkhead associated (FHA) protein